MRGSWPGVAAQRPRARLPGGSGQLLPTLRHTGGADKYPRRPSPPAQPQVLVPSQGFSELLGRHESASPSYQTAYAPRDPLSSSQVQSAAARSMVASITKKGGPILVAARVIMKTAPTKRAGSVQRKKAVFDLSQPGDRKS